MNLRVFKPYSLILLASLVYSHENNLLPQSKILAFRVTKYSSYFPYTCSDDMLIPELSEGTQVTIRIVGHLVDVKEVALTSSTENCGSIHPDTVVSMVKESDEVGSVTLTTPTGLGQKKVTLYFCFRAGPEHSWIHQGLDYWAKLIVVQRYKTVFVIIIGCALCIFFAAILNTSLLSVMSLDVETLRVKSHTGTEKERMVCRALMGLRKRGYIFAVAIVPAIVFLKTAITVFLKILFNGWMAIMLSTLIILVMVEVIPRIRKRTANGQSMDVHKETSEVSKQVTDSDEFAT